ncbi:DUF2382 domain-containing protein [Phytomonospora endophytica]|uniref:Uncharacterized protein (TIGR02271 family) n=1 Tax=Phytomonospora endophytica TaxID=714109 RepID=A0A841FDU7_9ACTN|nr:PRC and DUF2382 domain-containing protein [Phytomonospora endophytica]MBB6033994.1 uncharacterized protein (TIGR02271 family) [Phytomonospora endophytica]GIG64485.1 photosystem reaction center subunit H [Phytomonospora endophytica]
MIGQAQLAQLHDATVYDSAGEKIGGVKQVFVDDATGDPVVASVHTGFFGMSESFVPVHDGDLSDDGRVRLSVDKDKVRDAPRLEPSGDGDDVHLSNEQLGELYAYYNLPYGGGRRGYDRADMQDTGQPMAGQNTAQGRAEVPGTEAQDAAMAGMAGSVAGGAADTDSPEVTRYEEQLHVGTERVESGRVRLRKYVVTENVTKTVPVRHEEVRVERVPVEGTAGGEHEFTDETIEATTYAERPVVETEAVPVEKVRLEKDVRTTDQEVTGEVRHEEIDVDDGRRES